MRKMGLLVATLLLSGMSAVAAENTLMHCFAFTPNASAAQGDWDAFAKATNELPGKIQGLQRVWYGKLRAPLNAGQAQRTHGVCMEFQNMAAFEKYGAKDNAAHNAWTAVYNKVKQGGTTTYQIVPME